MEKECIPINGELDQAKEFALIIRAKIIVFDSKEKFNLLVEENEDKIFWAWLLYRNKKRNITDKPPKMIPEEEFCKQMEPFFDFWYSQTDTNNMFIVNFPSGKMLMICN